MANTRILQGIRPFLTAPLLLLASTSFAQNSERALELLRRSMGPAYSVNVVSVILQRDPSGDGTFQRVKVQRSKAGKTRHTVLQPLRLQGIESVDDGNHCLMYLPDEKLLIDQPSAQKSGSDVSWRFRLTSQNYKIKLGERTKVAGRSATVVIASPRYGDLDSRRYYIDDATDYPLRMDIVKSDGDVTVCFDTLDVQYPADIDADLFQMKPLGRVGHVTYGEPSKFLSTTAVRDVLGFTPCIPVSLPMGFRVQEMQRTQDPSWRALAIHMSDGLARATLYQWQGKTATVNIKAFADSSYREVEGLRMLLVSEVGARQRERLLDAFASHLDSDPQASKAIVRKAQSVGFLGRLELAASRVSLPGLPNLAAVRR